MVAAAAMWNLFFIGLSPQQMRDLLLMLCFCHYVIQKWWQWLNIVFFNPIINNSLDRIMFKTPRSRIGLMPLWRKSRVLVAIFPTLGWTGTCFFVLCSLSCQSYEVEVLGRPGSQGAYHMTTTSPVRESYRSAMLNQWSFLWIKNVSSVPIWVIRCWQSGDKSGQWVVLKDCNHLPSDPLAAHHLSTQRLTFTTGIWTVDIACSQPQLAE